MGNSGSIYSVHREGIFIMSPSRKGARISASSRPIEPTNVSNDTMINENITRAIATTDGRVLIEQPDGTYRLAESQTDWARLDAMSEAEVERLAAEDMAELDIAPDWMEHTRVVFPRHKERVTVRLDHDIVDWLKAQGRGYQIRINAILRDYVEAQKARQ